VQPPRREINPAHAEHFGGRQIPNEGEVSGASDVAAGITPKRPDAAQPERRSPFWVELCVDGGTEPIVEALGGGCRELGRGDHYDASSVRNAAQALTITASRFRKKWSESICTIRVGAWRPPKYADGLTVFVAKSSEHTTTSNGA
jgi:hypothetical protein